MGWVVLGWAGCLGTLGGPGFVDHPGCWVVLGWVVLGWVVVGCGVVVYWVVLGWAVVGWVVVGGVVGDWESWVGLDPSVIFFAR